MTGMLRVKQRIIFIQQVNSKKVTLALMDELKRKYCTTLAALRKL
jgi:hypothetical protein